MAENVPPKSAAVNGDSAAGIPFYEKQRQHLKELLAKKRALDKRIAAQEDSIYQKETDYLESTPSGNIITGFDNYIKGTTAGASSQRRKAGLTDANRVFSRCSISYNANGDAMTPASASSTPAAPTPLSGSFAGNNKDSGSATPTSATTTKGSTSKKNKKAAAAAAAAAAAEDSETDTRETKKARTNFGAVRR